MTVTQETADSSTIDKLGLLFWNAYRVFAHPARSERPQLFQVSWYWAGSSCTSRIQPTSTTKISCEPDNRICCFIRISVRMLNKARLWGHRGPKRDQSMRVESVRTETAQVGHETGGQSSSAIILMVRWIEIPNECSSETY